jgi:hypothetical protein
MDTNESSYAATATAAVDATGNLHVPDDYRTTFQSWAAGSQGQSSKELMLLCIARNHRGLSQERTIPRPTLFI